MQCLQNNYRDKKAAILHGVYIEYTKNPMQIEHTAKLFTLWDFRIVCKYASLIYSMHTRNN